MKDRDKIWKSEKQFLWCILIERNEEKRERGKQIGEGENNFVQVSNFSDTSFFSPLFAAFKPQPKQESSASRGF